MFSLWYRVKASTQRSGFAEDALVVGFVGGDDVVGAEFLFGVEASGFTHFAAAVGARQDFDGVPRSFLNITGLHQKSIHTVLHYFGDTANVCGDDGNFAGHSFEGREAEGFKLRGKKEKVGGGELFLDAVLFAEA